MDYIVTYRDALGTPVLHRVAGIDGARGHQVCRLFEYERSERVWLTFEEQYAGTPVAAQRYVDAWTEALNHAWLANKVEDHGHCAQ